MCRLNKVKPDTLQKLNLALPISSWQFAALLMYLPACRHQAVATLLIICANQLLLQPEHPGAVAILGDYNRHTIFVPRNRPPGPTRADDTTVIHGLTSFDTDESRQRAAGYMRELLASRCSQLRSVNFFETGVKAVTVSGGTSCCVGSASAYSLHVFVCPFLERAVQMVASL